MLLRMVIALPFVLVGCGGGDGGSRDDASTVKQMLRASATVQQAAAPLYACLPEQESCYTENGDALVDAVAQARAQFRTALSETDDECLADVGRLFERSLDAYARAGRAAAAGDARRFDAALSQSSRIEIRYTRRMGECGFSEGAAAETGAAMREVNIALIRLGEELTACGSDADCIVRVARRLEAESRKGRRIIGEFQSQLGSGAPGCLRAAVDVYARSLEALEKTAAAVQEGRVRVAEREGTRADRLGVQAQREMALCLETLGA